MPAALLRVSCSQQLEPFPPQQGRWLSSRTRVLQPLAPGAVVWFSRARPCVPSVVVRDGHWCGFWCANSTYRDCGVRHPPQPDGAGAAAIASAVARHRFMAALSVRSSMVMDLPMYIPWATQTALYLRETVMVCGSSHTNTLTFRLNMAALVSAKTMRRKRTIPAVDAH